MQVRDRLVAATAELMRRRGVAGTAVSEILADSNVARRSIYLNFPGGKAELVTEATRRSGEMIDSVVAAAAGEADPIGAFIAMWSELLSATDFDAGCPVVAATLGRTDVPEAADEAARAFTNWTRLITDRLITGDNVPEETAASLATTILAAIEGAVILAQALRTTDPLDQVGDRMRELVALHHVD